MMSHLLAILPIMAAGGEVTPASVPQARPAVEVRSGDGLALAIDAQSGRVTALAAEGNVLSPRGADGGFHIGEYRVDPGPELIANGDFAGAVAFETTGGWVRDTERFRSAGASLRLDVAEGGQVTVPVPFEAHRVYRIRFHILTDGLEGTPTLHVRRRDADGQIIIRQANMQHLGLYYPDWVQIEHTVQTLEGTAGGELMLHVPGGSAGRVWIDDLSVQELRLPELVPVEGRITQARDGATFRGEWNGVRITANIRGMPDRIAIDGQIEDTTGQDRAIQLAWRVPVEAEGWTWQTSLDGGQPIEPGRTYTMATEIGRNTNRYISRLPYTSLDGPGTGLSLAVPMDRPSVFLVSYTAAGELAIQHDFGLTRDTRSFPGRAEFAFVLSRHEPAWGLRAAADKYFRMFPQFFQVRIPPGSVFSTAVIAQVPNLRDFGAMYADRRNFANKDYLKRVDDAGMRSMTYNEPWMWRTNLPTGMPQSQVPPVEELLARELADVEVWDRNDARDYSFVPRAYSVRAFLNSVFHDEHGRPMVNANRSYGRGNRVVEWNTSGDPKIRGPYGPPNRGLLSWDHETLDDQRAGAERRVRHRSGVRYDSISEWVHLGAENHRREHFATATVPLTFSYRTGRPVQIGYFTTVEYLRFVRERQLAGNSFTYANEAHGAPWFMNLLDGMFRESFSRAEGVDSFQHIRSLIYQKNAGDWQRIRMEEPAETVERHLNFCLTYAWWPGMRGEAADFEQHRAVHRRYVPVLEALSQAGWEPITHARADGQRVVVERFGGRQGRPLYFTVRNMSDEARPITLSIDTAALNYPVRAVSDPLDGRAVNTQRGDDGQTSATVEVPGQWTVVLKIDR